MPENLPERRHSTTIREFEAKVREGCRRCGLEEFRGPLLAGFSGGADSTALILSLSSLMSGRGGWPSSLTAVHVDHGLRPGGAERDALHAEQFCKTHDIPFFLCRAAVDPAQGFGLEDAARKARRDSFLQAAQERGAKVIALAHTQDEQAETVLMRLFEGAGPKGLAGISSQTLLREESAKGDPSRGEPALSKSLKVFIVRPLLRVSRAEVMAYLEARGAQWVEDETNSDETRLRNLVRRRIIPILRETMGGAVTERIAGSADHLSDAIETLEASVDDACGAFLSKEGNHVRIFPLSGVRLLPSAVRAGLWSAALKTGGGAAGRRMALERIIKSIDRLALESGPSATLSLPGKSRAWRRYDSIFIGIPDEESPLPEDEVSLAIPGRTVHPGLCIEIEASPPVEGGEAPDGKFAADLDSLSLPEGIIVRTRRPGDRFYPPGGAGERKLKEFFIDRKIPRLEREYIPLLASGDEIIWAVGHAVSEKYRSRPGSRQFVALTARTVKDIRDL